MASFPNTLLTDISLPSAPLAAIGQQQKIGIAVAVLTAVVLVVYALFHLLTTPERPGTEVELAPNRKPYYDDETLEGPRLDRALTMALLLLVVSAVGLPLYWLDEPSRQDGAKVGFEKRSVNRGAKLFASGAAGGFGCADCHGANGQGGFTAPFTIADPLNPDAPPRPIAWKAPAVDTALLRFSRDEVRTILEYGRAGTPMPAWGVKGGGAMNDQQLDDLVNFLDSIKLKPEEARAAARAEAGAFNGETLFNAYCARCHTKGWSYDEPEIAAGGAFGPSLRGGATLRQFPNVDDHVDFIKKGSEFGKQYGERGVGDSAGGGMPGFALNLSDEQIRQIVEYERGL